MPRKSMVVDPSVQRDTTMKLHLTQGTLLNVSSAIQNAKAPKHIKWSQLSLDREIGTGAYSVVYAGKYHQNIPVAVKLLTMDSSEENREDFEREVGVLQSLVREKKSAEKVENFSSKIIICFLQNHSTIVKFHGSVLEDNKLAYVLEFCSNGSLSYLLVRDDITMLWDR
jgi:serine/threonine protein kinase